MSSTFDAGIAFPTQFVEFLVSLGAGETSPENEGGVLGTLIETYFTLLRWGVDEETRHSGLLCGLYVGPHSPAAPLSFDARDRVRVVAGDVVERLVYLLCILDRSSFMANIHPGANITISSPDRAGIEELTWTDAQRLCAILCAVSIASHRLGDRLSPADMTLMRRIAPYAPRAARAALDDLLAQQKASLTECKLARILGLESAEVFLRDFWPSRLFVKSSSSARFAGVLPTTIDELRNVRCAGATAFFSVPGPRTVHTRITNDQIGPLYDGGATIYLHSLDVPHFRPWLHEVSRTLGIVPAMTRLSAFASKRGMGIHTHYDMNDNIVLQVSGKKRWRLAKNLHVTNPTAGFRVGDEALPIHKMEAPGGLPAQMPVESTVVELAPGSVMFVPRGYWHDCETTDATSLHFNIQLGVPFWRELVEFLFTRTLVLGTHEMREGAVNIFMAGRLKRDAAEELICRIRARVLALRPEDFSILESEFEAYGARARSAIQ